MKKLMILILLSGLIAVPTTAQPIKRPPTPKEIKEEMDRMRHKMQEDLAKKHQKQDDAVKTKGPPEAFETEATEEVEPPVPKTKEEAIAGIEKNIREAERLHEETLGLIKETREKLEEKKKAGQVSNEDYELKILALEELEKQVNELKERTNAFKQGKTTSR